MILNITYTNAKNETKERTIVVMHSDEKQFEGLDLGYFNNDVAEISKINNLLRNHKVGPMPDKRKDPVTGKRLNQPKPIEGYDPTWNKAWRVFKKSNVKPASCLTKVEAAEYFVLMGFAKNKKSAMQNIRRVSKNPAKYTAYGFHINFSNNTVQLN